MIKNITVLETLRIEMTIKIERKIRSAIKDKEYE